APRLVVGHASAARALYEQCRRDERTATMFWRHLALLEHVPQLVHFEFLSLGAMYPLADQLLGVPVVVSCRGNDLHALEVRAAREQVVALECLHRTDAVHCVSDEMVREVTRISGRSDGLCVNHPAVEPDRH